MELAIDTSTSSASIALSNEGKVVVELTWHSTQNHTVELVPNIEYLLKQSGIPPESLDAIFVAKGPGSFNGLRVGVSTAKGLAFSLNIPLIAISTLAVEAYPFAFTGLLLCPIQSASRGELAAAFYRQNQEWQCLKEAHLTTVEALCRCIEETTVFCGEVPEPAAVQLLEMLGNKAVLPAAELRLRRAGFLAKLCWQRFKSGEQDNPACLQPTYLRQPPITQRKVK